MQLFVVVLKGHEDGLGGLTEQTKAYRSEMNARSECFRLDGMGHGPHTVLEIEVPAIEVDFGTACQVNLQERPDGILFYERTAYSD